MNIRLKPKNASVLFESNNSNTSFARTFFAVPAMSAAKFRYTYALKDVCGVSLIAVASAYAYPRL